MNMKKEYIKPTSSIMQLDYTGMLCNSGGTTITDKHFNTPESTTLPVNTGKDGSVWDDNVL